LSSIRIAVSPHRRLGGVGEQLGVQFGRLAVDADVDGGVRGVGPAPRRDRDVVGGGVRLRVAAERHVTREVH